MNVSAIFIIPTFIYDNVASFPLMTHPLNCTALLGDMQERIIEYFNKYTILYGNFLHCIHFFPSFSSEVQFTHFFFLEMANLQICLKWNL